MTMRERFALDVLALFAWCVVLAVVSVLVMLVRMLGRLFLLLVAVLLFVAACERAHFVPLEDSGAVDAGAVDVGDPAWPPCPVAWPPSPPIVYCGQASGVACYEVALPGIVVGPDGGMRSMLPCASPGEITLFPSGGECVACAAVLP